MQEMMPSVKLGKFKDQTVVAHAKKFGPPSEEMSPRDFEGCEEDLYGELAPRGAEQLWSMVKLTPEDRFADLGSGLGKLPVWAAALAGAKSALGVEYSAKRHAMACTSLKAVSAELRKRVGAGTRRTSRVELIRGDLMEQDYSRISVVFSNSVCFRSPLRLGMGAKLARELPEGARIVMTSYWPKGVPARIAPVGERSVEMTFAPEYAVQVFRADGPKPAA